MLGPNGHLVGKVTGVIFVADLSCPDSVPLIVLRSCHFGFDLDSILIHFLITYRHDCLLILHYKNLPCAPLPLFPGGLKYICPLHNWGHTYTKSYLFICNSDLTGHLFCILFNKSDNLTSRWYFLLI